VAPEGRILTTNQRFAEFFTLQQDLLLGRSFDDVQPVFERIFGDSATVARLARQFADTERRGTEDVTQRWPEHRELELYSTPVSGAEAQTLGRLFAFRDVTREREVDRMKSEFVALVSHELRTPLTSIKGYVDLLLAGDVGELETEQREFLAIVGNNADRLAALIADLLDLARIESGRIELARTPLDLGRVLTDLGAAFRPQVERKGQRLAVDLAPGLPALWADPARVTQILTNLLSNAHKYTPSGGGITVVARPDGAMVRIEVRDTGIGMTAEELAQLFTRFFRAKNRATQEVSGTGLGLAITRSLVQLHGGRIDVASAPGRGSTFTVTLPALASPAEAPALPSPPPRPGQRVLVVDDEPEIGLLLRRYLERAGYAVVEAHSADAALRLARREQPDLITMDIRMPDADGFTALEWLKGDPATARIPVLLISVLEDSGQGKLLGAVDHVAKPVAEAALLERVAAALAGANRRRVVLADADADARRPLAHLLRRQGYEVAEAADGAEAVALIRARRPDCALLDVRMPGTDGLAALAMLREDRTTRDLPVILLTASPGTSADVRPEAERLRVAGLVAKPSSPEELAAAMSAALGSGGRV
jgi:signal transduction histidine kinase/CheY-like chemotaxis protein